MTVSREFADLLHAGRRDFNARVAEAHHRYPSFSDELFSHFLTRCVDPLVRAAGAERRSVLASTAFDVALDLAGRELCGPHARGALLEKLWQAILPPLVALLPAQPAPLLCALCNALLNLQAQGARPEQWLQLLAEHGQRATATSLLDLGLLAAWRAGAAQYRSAALRLAANEPELARAIFGLPADGELATLLRLSEQDPWLLTPANTAFVPREVGAFAGFGGPFVKPPQVRACAEGFLVQSDDSHYLLLADSFGEALLPASAEEYRAAADYQPAATPAPSLQGARLCGPHRHVELDLCADGLQLVWNAHSAALFSPYSFTIYVAPWR